MLTNLSQFDRMNLIATIKSYCKQAISVLLMMGVISQGIAFGIAPAIAAPNIVDNNSSSIEQVDNKENQAIDRVKSAIKDDSQSTKNSLEKAKATADNNVKTIEKSAKDITKKTKNFFGF